METGINAAIDVRKNEEIDKQKLHQLLTENSVDIGKIKNIKQYPGGFSNLTYLVETDAGSYVLRRPPAGAKDIKGGHDMAREYRLLRSIESTGFEQIPQPIFLSESDNFLGMPFYLMKKVDGIILRASDAPKLLENTPPETFRVLSSSLCEQLVKLHAIDIQETGLIQIGKPNGYIERQVEGWFRRYEKSATDDLPIMKKLYDWLMANMPEENSPTLIHNDFKYDNVVFNPAKSGEIRAILDWEMTTVGDPLMDVGTSLAYWCELKDDDFVKAFNLSWLPGNLTRDEFAQLYAEKSGRNLSNILYYYVFGLFKNSVIVQQIYYRYAKGLTKDERFSRLIAGVKVLANKADASISSQQMK
jgi:aminoglycoside phosphotransferase (APT) family kinase protein